MCVCVCVTVNLFFVFPFLLFLSVFLMVVVGVVVVVVVVVEAASGDTHYYYYYYYLTALHLEASKASARKKHTKQKSVVPLESDRRRDVFIEFGSDSRSVCQLQFMMSTTIWTRPRPTQKNIDDTTFHSPSGLSVTSTHFHLINLS